nr:Chain T, Insulin-1 [Mus musculus]
LQTLALEVEDDPC